MKDPFNTFFIDILFKPRDKISKITWSSTQAITDTLGLEEYV